ncbi:MAG TPA: class I SAM-dependent methyltransferase [Vicinamibacterales bacterium]|nr:class I SAM-dependent methyltransferase [Vicinamibacterales bacterium]
MTDATSVIRHQAHHHFLMQTGEFADLEELGLHLRHQKAYDIAAGLSGDKRVLDYGCNNGYGTAYLAGWGRHVVGVDVSALALEHAPLRCRPSGPDYVRVDGLTIPFGDGVFDLIVSFQVIEHIADYARYLSELRRVLHPAGLLLMTTPNAQLRLDPGQPPWNEFHVHEFRGAELQGLLKEWFPCVTVTGLTTRGELYEVETRRLSRMKKMAQRQSQAVRWRARLARLLKRTIPAPWVSAGSRAEAAVRGVGRQPAPRTRPTLDAAVVAKYSPAQFILDGRDLDGAIDLVALCSADDHSGFIKQT